MSHPNAEVEQFLFQEAALLDARDYEAWIALVSEDIEYRMPITPRWSDRPGASVDTAPQMHFEDDFQGLRARVIRLGAKAAWSEQPPPLTRRMVTNVRVYPREGQAGVDSELEVRSNFLLARTRGGSPVELLAGERHDILRRTEAGLRIHRRTITLDQRELVAGPLNTLF